jgi:hypothetical protein
VPVEGIRFERFHRLACRLPADKVTGIALPGDVSFGKARFPAFPLRLQAFFVLKPSSVYAGQ